MQESWRVCSSTCGNLRVARKETQMELNKVTTEVAKNKSGADPQQPQEIIIMSVGGLSSGVDEFNAVVSENECACARRWRRCPTSSRPPTRRSATRS